MSTPVALTTGTRIRLRTRVPVAIAVGLAAVLARLGPQHIAKLLSVLRTRAIPATRQQASEARRAVIAVSAQCAGRGCLQRSLATCLLCRAAGTWPDWVVGVRTRPFASHAWVEADGEAIDETGLEAFAPILTVRAPRTIPAPG